MVDTKTVLITGCSAGIGRVTAQTFLDDGWQVYATARNTEDIEELGEAGCDVNTLDVTDPDDVERVVDRMIEQDGRIDCLVNNAGYAQHLPMEDVDDELLEYHFDVNVYGPHRLVRAVLPHMREREAGTIVNVSSVAGRLVSPGMGTYAGSKHALEAHSDALRNEVAAHGIDVSVVEPGPVETKMRDTVEEAFEEQDRTDAYEAIYSFQDDPLLLGPDSPFVIEPEEVAHVIHDVAVSSDPDPRYAVGTFATVMLKTRFLPDRIRDSINQLSLKLA